MELAGVISHGQHPLDTALTFELEIINEPVY